MANKKTYKIGKVAEAEIEGQKVIQIPVTVSEQTGIKNDEHGNEIRIINTVRFTVAIPLMSLPKTDKKLYVKNELKKAYQQFLADQDKYKDLEDMEFAE